MFQFFKTSYCYNLDKNFRGFNESHHQKAKKMF